MQVQLSKLWESGQALENFAALEFATAKRVYQVGRVHEQVTAALKPLKKAYTSMLRKYGVEVKDAEGKGTDSFYIQSGTENQDRFDAEWEDATLADIDLFGEPISLATLEMEFKQSNPDHKKFPLSARDVGALCNWLLVE